MEDLDSRCTPKIALQLCSRASLGLTSLEVGALWSAGCLPLDGDRYCTTLQTEVGQEVAANKGAPVSPVSR